MVCRRVHLTLVYAHAATACEGTGNKKQCTHQERKGSGHCWKEEVREKAYNQNVHVLKHAASNSSNTHASNLAMVLLE